MFKEFTMAEPKTLPAPQTHASTVQVTTDYKMFKNLAGNRPIDEDHVREMMNVMQKYGNLINHFPMVVNEKMEVIDGQHRLEALRRLKWPVAYRMEEDLTIATVRAINTAQRNWMWRDYANSYASLGNVNYRRLIELVDEFNLGYRVVMRFLGEKTGHRATNQTNVFMDGELEITPEKLQATRDKIHKAQEIIDAIGSEKGEAYSEVWNAIHVLLQNPAYNHERMIRKLQEFGSEMQYYRHLNSQLRAFEDIYNKHAVNPVRLF